MRILPVLLALTLTLPAHADDLDGLDRDTLLILCKQQRAKIAQIETTSESQGDKADALAAQVRDLQAKLDAVTAELDKLRRAVADDPALQAKISQAEKIKEAVASNRLAAGMTLDEANEAMGKQGQAVGSTEFGDEYEWRLYHGVANHANGPSSIWRAWLEDGRLVRFEKRL